MSWYPISKTVPQYVDSNGDPYSGAVIKAYQAGTSTPTNFATDNTGGTAVGSIALNAAGYPEVSGNVVIPHIDQDYKLALYADQTAADADSGAIWTVDNIDVIVVNGVIAKTSAYTVDTGDNGYVIDCDATGAAFTVTLPAAATAGDGFSVTIKKTDSSTNAVTIDGDGAETIDGATTEVLSYENQSVDLVCDGTQWLISSGVNDSVTSVITTVITGDTTHTPNAKTKVIQFICTGGGGGGGGFKCAGAGTSGSSGAGSGAGTAIKTTSTINTSYTVVVGAGGAGGNNAPSNGSAGEASTVVDNDGGTDMNLSGDGGGIGYASTASSGSSYAAGVSGGAATGGDINIRGGSTGTRGTISGVAIGNSLGGSSFLGGGANAVINGDGADCASYGGGGGGITSTAATTTGYAGGDGGDGVVIVTEYL